MVVNYNISIANRKIYIEYLMRIFSLPLAFVILISCSSESQQVSQEPQASRPAESKHVSTPRSAPHLLSMPQIKAHRGASNSAPENTLVSVRLAFDQGADACEIDVRVSSDGVVVVFHDEDTKRIGNRDRRVADQSLSELRQLDVGVWKHEKYTNERIATLAEILSIVPVGKTLFVEIKDGVEAVPAVLQAIKDSPTEGIVAIESFHAEVLQAIQTEMPQLPLHWTLGIQKDSNGSLVPFSPELAITAKSAGFTGLSVDARGISLPFAEAVHAKGLQLAAWTINTPLLVNALRQIPITWIESDMPAMVRKTLYPQ